MGKNDFLAPKAIANRMKAKGLQKLRWYCQLCQKQCRDENGFQCHLTSESHKRQMELFGMNPKRIVEGYSEEFEDGFMTLMRRAHPNSRVLAQSVYNEYIADRHHIHMNSTKWLTLTEFVKYLGREGKCKVEETPKGWYITLIVKDPRKVQEEESRNKRERAELAEEERARRQLEAQIERAKRARLEADGHAHNGQGGGQGAVGVGQQQQQEEEGVHELRRSEHDAPVAISLSKVRVAAAQVAEAAAARPKPAQGFADDHADNSTTAALAAAASHRPKTKLEELMERDRLAKEKQTREKQAAAAANGHHGGGGRAAVEPWVRRGLVVKILSKPLKSAGYYKSKAVVTRVLPVTKGRVVAELECGDGAVVQVDQEELETVLPQPGGRVAVVRGRYAGCRAVMKQVDVDKFRAQVELSSGENEGEVLWMEYEDVCKVSSSGGGRA